MLGNFLFLLLLYVFGVDIKIGLHEKFIYSNIRLVFLANMISKYPDRFSRFIITNIFAVVYYILNNLNLQVLIKRQHLVLYFPHCKRWHVYREQGQ